MTIGSKDYYTILYLEQGLSEVNNGDGSSSLKSA